MLSKNFFLFFVFHKATGHVKLHTRIYNLKKNLVKREDTLTKKYACEWERLVANRTINLD